MRLLTAALCTTVAAALLAACSSTGTSTSSAIPGSGGMGDAGLHAGNGMVPFHGHYIQLAHHGDIFEAVPHPIKHKKGPFVKPPPGGTRGLYASAFFLTSDNIWGYPKNNSADGPPTCFESTGTNVNDFASDSKGNLMIPNAFSGVDVYAPPPTAGACGTLVGDITDSAGQATSAASLDAMNGTIVVGNIGGGSSTGVLTCLLSTLSCTPLTSPRLGETAGVTMDKDGNCYADAFDASTGLAALWVYAGCTGTGTELTSANGFNEPYYGGIAADQRGNIVVISLFNSSFTTPSTVTVYSGCITGTCTVVGGPFALNGESIFGHLGRWNERFATTNLSVGDGEVYQYTPGGTGLTFMYSWTNGMSGCITNDCESAGFQPASPR